MRHSNDFLKKIGMKMKEDNCSLARAPLVEICGCRRVLIENHIAILVYAEDQICVKVRFGMIIVSGLDLRLCRVSKDQLIICGKIYGVTMKRSDQ